MTMVTCTSHHSFQGWPYTLAQRLKLTITFPHKVNHFHEQLKRVSMERIVRQLVPSTFLGRACMGNWLPMPMPFPYTVTFMDLHMHGMPKPMLRETQGTPNLINTLHNHHPHTTHT